MPAAGRSVYEAYLLGIALRSRSVQQRCKSLLTREFASEAPRRLAKALAKMAKYLARVATTVFDQISWDDEKVLARDLRQLQTIDLNLRMYAAHLRYVHGAQSETLPWSTIPAIETFFRRFATNTRFLLRPKWNYNYSATAEDLLSGYLEGLEEFEGYLPGESIEQELRAELDEPLHLIAFPSLERDNIVLHSLFGHEFGHYFVDSVLTPELEDPFKQKVLEEVAMATDQELIRENATVGTTGENFSGNLRAQRVGRNTRLAWLHYRRALEELLADAVSIFLFGPAALFSMLEIALQENFDQVPLPQHDLYPPWRLRLRSALWILDQHRNRLFPDIARIFQGSKDSQDRAQRVVATVDYIRLECEKAEDQRAIDMSPIARIAYRQVNQDLAPSVERLLSSSEAFANAVERFSTEELLGQVRGLIERLENGITPNALESQLDDRQEIDIVAILNAASLYRVSLDPRPTNGGKPDIEQAIALRSRADRLTLKAIELSDLAASYWKANPKEARHQTAMDKQEDSQSKQYEARGVLSKSEIRAALYSGDLPDRLIVTPLLDPEESIGAGAIDVRLGNQFLIFKQESFTCLDIASDGLDLERYQERQIKAFREPFILHPQQLVIGSTLEYIQLPKDLMCYVIGKSTWGRMGLIIATATKVDPGYRGCITLEIINEGEVPLVLYPGIPIAQLVLHRTQAGEGYQGGYSCATGPEFPDFLRKKASWDYWTPRRQKKTLLYPHRSPNIDVAR